MRILRRRLVNLSEIINEAAGLIDCGSDGERKSGGPDINIPPSIIHLSLSYQFRLFQQTRHAFFPLFTAVQRDLCDECVESKI